MTNLIHEEAKDIDPFIKDFKNNKAHIRRKRVLSYEQEFSLCHSMNEEMSPNKKSHSE